MKGLNNPAAVLAVSEIAKTKTGEKTLNSLTRALNGVLILSGIVAVGYLATSEYKKWAAKKYANENIGNPNLTAAAVIYNSFSRFELPTFIGSLFGSIDISTDEEALNKLALKVTDIKAVSDAYNKLFDRTLFEDIKNGLDTEELVTFWNKINAPTNNQDTTTNYPIGTLLYCADKGGIFVNKVTNDNNNWNPTNVKYGQFSHGDLVGKVVDYGVVNIPNDPLNGQIFYIVKKVFNAWFPSEGECINNCDIGVVVQSQIEPKQ